VGKGGWAGMSIDGCIARGDVDFAVAHFGGVSFVSLCYFVIFKLFIGQRAAEKQPQRQELQFQLQVYTERKQRTYNGVYFLEMPNSRRNHL